MTSGTPIAWKSLGAGVVLGVGIGWLAFAPAAREAAAVPAPSASAAAQGPPSATAPAAAPLRVRDEAKPADAATTAPAQDERAQAFASGDARSIRFATRAENPPTAEDVRRLLGRLDAARDDRELYFAILQALGASGDPAARTKLVEVLGDPAVPLVSLGAGVFRDFESWMREGCDERIAAAALRRMDANMEAGYEGAGDESLLLLVARHGTAEDLRRLEEAARVRDRTGTLAARAIASVERPEAIAAFERLVAEGRIDDHALESFAKSNSAKAREVAAKSIRAIDDGGTEGRHVELNALMRVYGSTVAADSIGAARDFLLSLHSPKARLGAVYAVEAMAAQKLDVSSFEPILDAPLLQLAQQEFDGYGCMYAIEYNRVLWTTRSADALEAAAPRAGSLKDGFLKVAKRIRTELADPWRRK